MVIFWYECVHSLAFYIFYMWEKKNNIIYWYPWHVIACTLLPLVLIWIYLPFSFFFVIELLCYCLFDYVYYSNISKRKKEIVMEKKCISTLDTAHTLGQVNCYVNWWKKYLFLFAMSERTLEGSPLKPRVGPLKRLKMLIFLLNIYVISHELTSYCKNI